MSPDPAAMDQGRAVVAEPCTQAAVGAGCWCLQQQGGNCTHGVVGTRAGSKGQGRMVYALAIAGALAGCMHHMAAGTHHQRVAVEPTWDWAKGTQAHIWRG